MLRLGVPQVSHLRPGLPRTRRKYKLILEKAAGAGLMLRLDCRGHYTKRQK